MPSPDTSVRTEEVQRFDALAASWWDPNGPMRELHRMNPARIGWVVERARQVLGTAVGAKLPLHGVTVLDVGCGAGLASEAFARLGARVVGIDAAPAVIAAARRRANRFDPAIDYRVAAPEDLTRESFDVVVAFEVVEHVTEPMRFCASLGARVRRGGLVALSTLNRTPLSWATAKLGAEFLLRLLPAGTHDWRSFLTPAELAHALRSAGLGAIRSSGLQRNLDGTWRTGRRLDVNYLISGVRA